MLSFKINGQAILPTNANNPIELVSQSITCNSSGETTETTDTRKIFFATANNGSGGRVVLSGVTNSGYKLITADNNTAIASLKEQDAFKGKLKINGSIRKYCNKGLAPLGTKLIECSPGTYYFYRRYDGYCELQDANGSAISTLSTVQERRKIYTFFLCGGGGAGTSGGSGMGWWGGGGGGGSGAAVLTLEFTELATTNHQDLKIQIDVASGGAGADPSGRNGGSGGQTTMTPTVAESSFGTAVLAYASGGGASSKKSGGGGGSGFVDSARESNSYYKVVAKVTASGGGGGNEASSGGGTDSTAIYNYSVNSNYISSMGNTSGGGKSGGGNGGGGGGASPFANGNDGVNGSGGHGGEGAFGSGKGSQGGGNGFMRIYY